MSNETIDRYSFRKWQNSNSISAIDTPLDDPIKEAEAQFLIEHLIRPGQRLASVRVNAKSSHPLECHAPNDPYFRNLIRLHIVGGPATVVERPVALKDNKTGIALDNKTGIAQIEAQIPVLNLGLYYGGWNGSGNNTVTSFALDCDLSDVEYQLCAAEKALGNNYSKEIYTAALKAAPIRMTAETIRLSEMLELARKLFPLGRAFQRANGKWHFHCNLSAPVDAHSVKLWVASLLPPELSGVEIFPKTASINSGRLLTFGVGNQVRLPFAPSVPYAALDALTPMLPMDASLIPVYVAPVATAKSAKHAKEDTAVPQILSEDFSEEVILGCSKLERKNRYRSYLLSEKFPQSIDGQKGHARILIAAGKRRAFCVCVSDAREVLNEYNEKKCRPMWTPEEINHKLADGKIAAGKEDGYMLKPSKEPISEEPVGSSEGLDAIPSKVNTTALAEKFLLRFQFGSPDDLLLRHWRTNFYKYTGTHFKKVSDAAMETKITKFLIAEKLPVNRNIIANILQVLNGFCDIDEEFEAPVMIDTGETKKNYLSTKTGILNLDALANIQIIPHSPNFFTMSSVPYAYDPEATCPKWLKFLSEVLPDNDIRQVIQEWFGYNLIFDVTQQKMMILYGEGSNGKSVVCMVLKDMIGAASYSSIGLESFNATRTFPMAATQGKLANIAEEIGAVDKAAEGVLKQFSTGGSMTIEEKFKPAFMLNPTARLTFSCNPLPHFSDKSDGIWRRLLLIPFQVQIIDEKKQNKNMVKNEYWETELPGVLNWALEGLKSLKARGYFTDSRVCNVEKIKYRKESNPAGEWIDDNYQYGELPKGKVLTTNSVYMQYKRQAIDMNQKPLGNTQFTKELFRVFPKAKVSEHAISHAGERHYQYFGILNKNDAPEEDRGSMHVNPVKAIDDNPLGTDQSSTDPWLFIHKELAPVEDRGSMHVNPANDDNPAIEDNPFRTDQTTISCHGYHGRR